MDARPLPEDARRRAAEGPERRLARAVLGGDLVAFAQALEQGAPIYAVSSPERWTWLHRALLSPRVHAPASMLQALLDCGLDPDARDAQGRTPLHHAAAIGHAAAAQVLRAAGADTQARDAEGLTPLQLARGLHPLQRTLHEALGATDDAGAR